MNPSLAPLPAPNGYLLPGAIEPAKAMLKRARRLFLATFLAPMLGLAAYRSSLGESLTEALVFSAGNLFFVCLGAGFVVAVVYSIAAGNRLNRRLIASWKSHDYGWYRKAFAEHVTSKGDVTCRHCGGEHIDVKNVMNQTFLRSHSCHRCGQTLYYSPENV